MRASGSTLLMCCAVLLVTVGPAWGVKREVSGYSVSQLTDNDATDWFARVSKNGRIAWLARYNLGGAVNPSSEDLEFMA